jgi:hypothetical protein
VDIVRNTIGDVENVEEALSIICADPDATSATLTIADGTLSTFLSGSSYSDLDITLSDYETLRDLVNAINAEEKYSAELLGDNSTRSPSDIIAVSNSDISKTLRLETMHWFSDTQILGWADDFCNSFFQDCTTENIPDSDELFLALSTALHGCNLLIADSAKYYSFSIEGFSGNRGNLVQNYTMLYNTIQGRIEDIGYPVRQSSLSKSSRTYQGMSPTSFIESVPTVRLISADVNDDDVTLTWGLSSYRGFYCYEVWRSKNGADFVYVTQLTNRHNRDYTDETLAVGSYTYKVKVVGTIGNSYEYPEEAPSINRLSSESNTITVEVD